MFEHSVKVPRHFKIAANIFKKVSTEGGSVKTLLYDSKLRHFRTNVLYALVTETIKHTVTIDKIFENCKLLSNEPRLDPWLAKVLTAELLFGKKCLPGQSKPEQTILSYKEQIEKHASEHQDDLKTEGIRRPRYVRVNTNLLTTSDAIRAFQDDGYHFIRCTSGTYDDYLEQLKGLTEYDFTQDYHVKTMFVFPPGTKLHQHELYLENKIILQDKATAMAVHLLAAPSGAVVLDMCAAPGMKTTQLAAYMRNEGKIYALERNEKRYQTLCDFVEKTGSRCVETLHKDCLEVKRGDYDDVEYILLDPSCSGSGMELCVHDYIEESRLAKLTSLQEKFLKHAMNAFPKAKRIVYSTCSIFPEENERVITNVVKTSRAKWRVQEVKELLKGQWNNFGSGMYGSMGARCMYARPETDLTIGFFLAVLDRDPKDLEKSQQRGNTLDTPAAENIESGSKDVFVTLNKDKKSKQVTDVINIIDEDENKISKKKKNKHDDSSNDNITRDNFNLTEDIDTDEANKVGKKKKRKKTELTENINDICENSNDLPLSLKEVKSKKKKRKNDNVDDPELAPKEETKALSEEPLRKKKKKHKTNEHNLEGETAFKSVNTEIEPNNLLSTSKKKKNRDKDKIVMDC